MPDYQVNPADLVIAYNAIQRNQGRLPSPIDGGKALTSRIQAARMGLGGAVSTLPARRTAARPPTTRPNEAQRIANSGRNTSPYGISGGGTDQFFDATAGGIKGRVNVLLQATEAISTSGTDTIDANVAFTANDQSRVGSVGRVLEQLFVEVAVSGTMPSGYDATSLRRFLIGSTYVQPEIGGVPQVQIPTAAMVDTNFIDRSFKFMALLDPGNFPSLNFNWNSDTITPPAPASATWTARLLITAVFSPPLRG